MICDDIWYMIYVVLCLFFVIKFCFLSFWDSTCCRSMRSCRSLTDQPSFRPFRAWHVANIRSRTILAPTWWNSGNILVLRVALELNTSTGTTKGASCHLQGAYVGVFSYCTAECMIVNLCIQKYIIIHHYTSICKAFYRPVWAGPPTLCFTILVCNACGLSHWVATFRWSFGYGYAWWIDLLLSDLEPLEIPGIFFLDLVCSEETACSMQLLLDVFGFPTFHHYLLPLRS